jgi:hypothetical protein
MFQGLILKRPPALFPFQQSCTCIAVLSCQELCFVHVLEASLLSCLSIPTSTIMIFGAHPAVHIVSFHCAHSTSSDLLHHSFCFCLFLDTFEPFDFLLVLSRWLSTNSSLPSNPKDCGDQDHMDHIVHSGFLAKIMISHYWSYSPKTWHYFHHPSCCLIIGM